MVYGLQVDEAQQLSHTPPTPSTNPLYQSLHQSGPINSCGRGRRGGFLSSTPGRGGLVSTSPSPVDWAISCDGRSDMMRQPPATVRLRAYVK